MPAQTAIVCEETFAPILYVFTFRTLDEAIVLHNGVDQGLSSAIFTESLRAAGLDRLHRPRCKLRHPAGSGRW